MIETVIAPVAMIGFLLTWGLAEAETIAREANRPLPQPEPTPEVIPTPTKRRWF